MGGLGKGERIVLTEVVVVSAFVMACVAYGAARGAKRERDLAQQIRRLEDANRALSAPDPMLEEAMRAAERAAAMVEVEQRKARELFGVVESVLAERDQWKQMWFVQSREHLNAQNALEHALESSRAWLRSALVAINKYREEKGMARIAFGNDPKDPPVGTAAKFEAMLEQAKREAPESVDGLALRERIVASSVEGA